VLLGSIDPKDQTGAPLYISGISLGTGNQLFVALYSGLKIAIVSKTTGAWIGDFYGPASHPEGLECDPVDLAPTIVLWFRNPDQATVEAIELAPRTCSCEDVVPTKATSWGAIKARYR
jgi:hypothetical protein